MDNSIDNSGFSPIDNYKIAPTLVIVYNVTICSNLENNSVLNVCR